MKMYLKLVKELVAEFELVINPPSSFGGKDCVGTAWDNFVPTVICNSFYKITNTDITTFHRFHFPVVTSNCAYFKKIIPKTFYLGRVCVASLYFEGSSHAVFTTEARRRIDYEFELGYQLRKRSCTAPMDSIVSIRCEMISLAHKMSFIPREARLINLSRETLRGSRVDR